MVPRRAPFDFPGAAGYVHGMIARVAVAGLASSALGWLAAMAGCAATTFDPWDRLRIRTSLSPEALVEWTDPVTAQVEVEKALLHYGAGANVFLEVSPHGEPSVLDPRTILCEARVLKYKAHPDENWFERHVPVTEFVLPPLDAVGSSLIRYRFVGTDGHVVFDATRRAYARHGIEIGQVRRLGGINQTAEGAGRMFAHMLRDLKTNPGEAAPLPPDHPPPVAEAVPPPGGPPARRSEEPPP